jgi:adenine-specific DNA methylase
MPDLTFIETQFPVSKLSKESYKERKSNVNQTLTSLGKWWGRKPLVLIRAALFGVLMPASVDPKKDREIFLKLMTMDEEGLWRRRRGNISASEVYQYATETEREFYFTRKGDKWQWKKSASREDREHLQHRAFNRMSYDEKLSYCMRPEEIEGPSEEAWKRINAHLGTNVNSLQDLVRELGKRRFAHIPRVGDAFCGGGSGPFEAAVLGCDVYGADLSPVSALLTWAAIHLIGGGEKIAKEVQNIQKKVYEAVQRQIDEWGIERNDEGWLDETTGERIGKGCKADYYLYCVEATDPHTGWRVPLAPSWIIGQKTRTIAKLVPDKATKSFRIEIIQGVSAEEMEKAKYEGTWENGIRCPVDREGNWLGPHSRQVTPTDELRGRQGLRLWENDDLVPRPDDVLQERLYCIRWVDPETEEKYYRSPKDADLRQEAHVIELVKERFAEWQAKGYLPCRKIEPGYNTDQPIRERGWTHWHHLYNPRQLLTIGLYQEVVSKTNLDLIKAVGLLLGIGRYVDWHSRLCRWDSSVGNERGSQTFFNQALNTLANYGCRAHASLDTAWYLSFPERLVRANNYVVPLDARVTSYEADFWITDPPYADAINYEELSELFLAWYEKRLPSMFPDWYADSKRALAVKGSEENFRLSMVECYRRLAENMPDNGFQLVMFTHQDVEVWSDLALILWTAGLHVTAAWTIATETDTSFRTGKYVQGTVLLILRKRKGYLRGDRADIYPEVLAEVQKQLKTMIEIDDKDDPNFSDADYQLAAYAAALRVVTAYSAIEDIDVERELRRVRKLGESSPLADLIRSAVKIASDFLVPDGLDRSIWRYLSPEERFYLKGVEVEAHGEYRDGVYQEFARGFGVKDYRGLLGSDAANRTRLKTPTELKGRDLSGQGFAGTLLRQVLFAIYKTVEEENPKPGLTYLKQELSNYWDRRQTILALLDYLSKKPSTMEHWRKDADAAHLLRGAISEDGV